MKRNKVKKDEVILVYDGDCPVCRNYCKYVQIKKAVGKLTLVDARKESLIMDEIVKKGLNIDEGMVLKVGEKIYYGSAAVHVLSLMGTKSGLFNRLNYLMFSSNYISKIFYPICKGIRNILLWIYCIEKINTK